MQKEKIYDAEKIINMCDLFFSLVDLAYKGGGL